MPLTDDEFRDVLARAEEIQQASRHGEEWNAELAAVTGPAEEVGLSRRAVDDRAKKSVKVNDSWGETKTFPVSEVWLARPKPEPIATRKRLYLTMVGAGVGVRALIGSIVTALVLR